MASLRRGNVVPVAASLPADLLSPMLAYLRLAAAASSHSFLFESVLGGERIGRYSFMGSNPRKVVRVGDNELVSGDPLPVIQKELSAVAFIPVDGVPDFTGGAVGFISYDCVRFFEPKTARPLSDPLAIPDAVLFFCDSIVVFDHLFGTVKVISHAKWIHDAPAAPPGSQFATSVAPPEAAVRSAYQSAVDSIRSIVACITSEHIPQIPQGPVRSGEPSVSNVGQHGYEQFVRTLKEFILKGDIIQAVPSQRLKRRTDMHPLNAYRKLRSINPSPYMFYLDLGDFQIVGASPEMLVKVQDRVVYTHPIAGTRKRGKTPQEDANLAHDLISNLKERSEHIMLVDLGRNDVNRVCVPSTVKVDSLMHIERYAHVMHIVSNVSGTLRDDQTCFDAFRSIFPAGTVSGAPKVRAMQLIYDLEREKRGVYAGAVGYFTYAGGLDTCIAIRTMVFKDGHVYLQAGGGIVHDSEPTAEYVETVNKLRSNVVAIESAELEYA